MAKAKRYTAEQLSDAEKMAATLANVPEEKRTLVIMMTNSFMAGMEAQKAMNCWKKKESGHLITIRKNMTGLRNRRWEARSCVRQIICGSR